MEFVIRLNEKDVLAHPELLDAIKGLAGHSAVPKTAADRTAPAPMQEKAVAEPSAEKASSPAEPPVEEPAVGTEEVRAALAKVREEHGAAHAKAILQKHGAESLSGLDASLYTAVLAEAKEVR